MRYSGSGDITGEDGEWIPDIDGLTYAEAKRFQQEANLRVEEVLNASSIREMLRKPGDGITTVRKGLFLRELCIKYFFPCPITLQNLLLNIAMHVF